MAQVLVSFQIGYSDMLVVDSKDAQTLLEIFDRAKTACNKYTDNVAVYLDKKGSASISVKSINTADLMTEEMYEVHQAEKATAEEAALREKAE